MIEPDSAGTVYILHGCMLGADVELTPLLVGLLSNHRYGEGSCVCV